MVLHVTVEQPRGGVRRGGGQQLFGGALAEEGVHLADAALDGQGWAVGQVGLEGAPDPLNAGTHTGGGLVESVVLWKASATREATSWLRSPVTSTTSAPPLSVAGCGAASSSRTRPDL